MSLSAKYNMVSSANDRICPVVEQFPMSLTYIKNNKGPNIEPWGTPQLIFWFGDLLPSISTYCCRFDR